MKHQVLLTALLAIFLGKLSADMPQVRLKTTLGELVVVLDGERAPRTVANFLRYVEAGAYDGGNFHRTVTLKNQPDQSVKIEIVQGGLSAETASFSAVALERTSSTGLSHLAGTVSMARAGPDTTTSEFFICVTDQLELDFGGKRNPDGQGFAAFGRVVSGMDVVKKIHQAPSAGQSLSPPVKIISIHRISKTDKVEREATKP